MTRFDLAMFAPLFALLAWAAVTDCRWRRIPNWLTLSLALGGLAQSLLPGHLLAPAASLAGLAVGFTVSFLLYLAGGQGAGDVKLLAGVGAWLGPAHTLCVFAAAALLSMIVALILCVRRGQLRGLAVSSLLSAVNLLALRRPPPLSSSIGQPLPHAPLLLAATAGVLFGGAI
jgi:prepilin peptidase CpaA